MTQLTLTYPASPGWKARDTSRRAAREMKQRAPTIQERILTALKTPMTADECAYALGLSILAVRPRFSELEAVGMVEDTGLRRLNTSRKAAIVWRRI